MYYINEPTVQQLPYFVQFMGGVNFVRSTQALEKLTAAPKHWRGTKIAVTKRGSWYKEDVPVAVFQDEILVHCNHAHQELESVTAYPGLDYEYEIEASVCQRCGAGWDKSGEQCLEASQSLMEANV